MNKDELKLFLDLLFQFIEARCGKRPILVAVLEGLRQEIDSAGLDALLAFLHTHGWGLISGQAMSRSEERS